MTSCIPPAKGTPIFDIGDDEMEVGVGIHGEPGRERRKLASADEITEALMTPILDDGGFGAAGAVVGVAVDLHDAVRRLEHVELEGVEDEVGAEPHVLAAPDLELGVEGVGVLGTGRGVETVAGDDQVVAVAGVARIHDQVAEAGVQRDHLRGDDDQPRHAEADAHADDDLRQNRRKHDPAKQHPAAPARIVARLHAAERPLEPTRPLDASAGEIREAMAESPGSIHLLDQLKRTYSRRLALTQRAALG